MLQLRRLAVVISPLLSLMQDQEQSLLKRGIKVARLGSDVSRTEQQRVVSMVADGNVSVLLVSPERLLRDAGAEKNPLWEALRARHRAEKLGPYFDMVVCL